MLDGGWWGSAYGEGAWVVPVSGSDVASVVCLDTTAVDDDSCSNPSNSFPVIRDICVRTKDDETSASQNLHHTEHKLDCIGQQNPQSVAVV